MSKGVAIVMVACYRSSTLIRYYAVGVARADDEVADQEEDVGDMAEDWRTPDVEALFNAILTLESTDETERFFRDLCTLNELRDMAQRWAVVRLLEGGLHYAEISRRTGASTATITRIASWLNHGEGGYRAMLDKLDAASRSGTTPYPVAGER
jgi:TrpR-related protein YerC/YecD